MSVAGEQGQASGAPLKGSWEDLLLQAEALAAREDDGAIPILQKLVNRLSALPAAQRMAADGRLEKVLLNAAVDLQDYLTLRDRYAEALAVNRQVAALLTGTVRLAFDYQAAALQIQSGAVQEGLDALLAMAEDGEIDRWGDALFAALQQHELAAAERAVRGAEAWVNRQHAGKLDSEEAKRDQAYVAFLKARLVVDQAQAEPGKTGAGKTGAGKVAEGLAWFEHAAMLDPFYRKNPQYLYTQLIDAGAYAEAQALIRRDQQNPIRAAFWLGLAYYRSGQFAEAERQWQRAIQQPLPEDGPVDYLELVLARYYLGDHDGVGLASVLRAIKDDPNHWGLFYLAGLGWAMRNDMVTARADMHVAQSRRKMRGEGVKLSQHWWRFCTELLDTSKLEQLTEFFEDAQVQRPT